MKQADPIYVQAQDIEENEVQVAEDTSNQQVQVANTDSQVDEEQQDPNIPEDQTSRASQDDNYQTAIMMTGRMTQYNSAIQLPNHSCQEV